MRLPIRECVVAAALLLTPSGGAPAQDRAVALEVGSQWRLFLEKPFATVIIGDPEIVDVRTDDDQSVVVEPLKGGVTNLVFVDAHGMVTANVKVSVCGGSASAACATHQSSL